jgi:hypothetical protein
MDQRGNKNRTRSTGECSPNSPNFRRASESSEIMVLERPNFRCAIARATVQHQTVQAAVADLENWSL